MATAPKSKPALVETVSAFQRVIEESRRFRANYLTMMEVGAANTAAAADIFAENTSFMKTHGPAVETSDAPVN